MSFVVDPYAQALTQGGSGLYLRPINATEDTPPVLLEVSRWCAPADEVDDSVLSKCVGPVLDVGCGPGRLTVAAAAYGLPSLGVDVAPSAVKRTVNSGGTALCRSVFDSLPGEGRWATVLLIDGNVGIGGDPLRLLRRCASLMSGGGQILVEINPSDVDLAYTAYLVDDDGRRSEAFPWAQIGEPALRRCAQQLGFGHLRQWLVGGRKFCELAWHEPPVTLSAPRV